MDEFTKMVAKKDKVMATKIEKQVQTQCFDGKWVPDARKQLQCSVEHMNEVDKREETKKVWSETYKLLQGQFKKWILCDKIQNETAKQRWEFLFSSEEYLRNGFTSLIYFKV